MRDAAARAPAGQDPWVAPCGRGWATLIAAFVFLTVFLTFWPGLHNGFVDWDDTDNILKNTHYRGLGPEQLSWMFTTSHLGHYQPLSWITLGGDYLWGRAVLGDGMDPRSYHLTNNLLHAVNAVLVYLLALRLLGGAAAPDAVRRTRGVHGAAALAALLFALHPLRVESVAWVTERRDVLSSFFLLLTVLCYLRAQQPLTTHHRRWMALAVVLHTLSLLSRAMAVTLPVILLLLDWYPLRRLGGRRTSSAGVRPGRVWLEKIPFLVLSLSAGVTAVWAQHASKATYTLETLPVAARLAQMCYGLVFYLRKTLLPLDLSPIYEIPLPLHVDAPRYVVAITLVLVAVAIVGALAGLGRSRYLVVAAACYAVLILPVSGLVQSGNQEAADRYSYIPAVALAVLLAAGIARLWMSPRVAQIPKISVAAAAGVVLLLLAVLTWRQCAVWRSTATLWKHAAAVAPESSIAQNGYGWVLQDQKHYDLALVHLRRALEIQPRHEKAHVNLWLVLEAQSKMEGLGEAEVQRRIGALMQAYRDTIRVLPECAEAHYNLGVYLAREKQGDEAEKEYRRALELRPDYAVAHTNLASILERRGQVAEALEHYQAAVAADPRNLFARRGLANLLKALHRDNEAIAQLRAALAVDPGDMRSKELLEKWAVAPANP